MKTTCIEAQGVRLFVIGSNGLIGSRLEQEILRELKTRVTVHSWEYQSKDYAKLNPALLHRFEGKNEVVFCGGSGGFSITRDACERQRKEFSRFCKSLAEKDIRPEYFTCISSLGAIVSTHNSPYKTLIKEREETLRSTFRDIHTTIRVPSLYGHNRITKEAKGLIAILTDDSLNNKTSRIFGRLGTSRNYLSAKSCCNSIAKTIILQPNETRKATMNFMATKNYTIRELCSELTRAFRKVPMIRLLDGQAVDCESHYPRTADGVRLELPDDVHGWICKRLQGDYQKSRQ